MNIKRWLAGCVAVLVVAMLTPQTLLATTPVKDFNDVTKDHPNYEAIMDLKTRGIISGYQDGTFKPDKEVNRVEAIKIILLGVGVDTSKTTLHTFSDTSSNGWYAAYLNKAFELAIVKGYDDGTFKPDQTVNLAENLKMLLKAENITISTTEPAEDPYADTPKDAWYANYVLYAKDHNLIDTNTENMVFPGQGMTRGKLAELIFRMIYIKEHNLDWYPPPEMRNGMDTQQSTQQSTQQEFIYSVTIQDFSFTKNSITVPIGTAVRWSNNGSANHTVTSDSGNELESGTLAKSDTYLHTFNTNGTYTYHCKFHPGMTGTIVVKPVNEVPTI